MLAVLAHIRHTKMLNMKGAYQVSICTGMETLTSLMLNIGMPDSSLSQTTLIV